MINNILRTLSKNERFRQVINQGKNTGVIKAYFTSLEKWNYNSEKVGKEEFDNEGKTWEDIEVDFSFNLFKPKHLKDYIVSLFKYKDISLKTKRWLWTIDSFIVEKWDLAEKLAADIVSLDKIELRFVRDTKSKLLMLDERTEEENQLLEKYKIERDKQFKRIDKIQLINYVLENHIKLSNGIYLNKEDLTCITVDESFIPFDMKDGWSNKKLIYILNYYFEKLGYQGIKIISGE